jgi:hypothetical protein
LEAEPVHETLAGHDAIGYDLNFYYLDLTNTAAVRSLKTRRHCYTIFYQAEDREFDEVQKVFQAITVSLMDGLDEPGAVRR